MLEAPIYRHSEMIGRCIKETGGEERLPPTTSLDSFFSFKCCCIVKDKDKDATKLQKDRVEALMHAIK